MNVDTLLLYLYLQGTFVYSLYSCVHMFTHNEPTYFIFYASFDNIH